MGSHRFVLPLLLAVQVCALPGIFKAVEKDSVEDLEAHLKADPTQLNAIGPDGQTPLMNAVLTGKVNAVKFLLSKGADTTIGEKDGYTPMHGAGFQGRAEIAKILIAHGLDPFDVHKDGHTPMTRACWGRETRHTLTVRAFVEAGASEKSLGRCLSATRSEATKRLVKEALEKLQLSKNKDEM